MQLQTFFHNGNSGWSQSPLPELDSDQTLVIAFGAPRAAAVRDALADLSAQYPRATIIGCSSAGEIFGTQLMDRSLVVAALRFEHTRLRSATAPLTNSKDSFAAGQRIAGELLDPQLRGVFVLCDGLATNGSELVRGLNSALPDGVVVTGGLAGDGDRFQRTWVLAGQRTDAGLVTAVGLYGDAIRIAHGSRGGWDIFGVQRQVTRAEGNTLYELDGQPALALYKQYLGERAAGLPATGLLFPLALLQPDQQVSVVRTILSVDEAAQSITFAGDIPTGAMTQLMRANFDRLIDGACEAATHASLGTPAGVPLLSIAISCIGRRLVLGERSEEEIETTLDMMPDGTRQIGFYSYGEISPLASGNCELHNQTMTLTTFAEV